MLDLATFATTAGLQNELNKARKDGESFIAAEVRSRLPDLQLCDNDAGQSYVFTRQMRWQISHPVCKTLTSTFPTRRSKTTLPLSKRRLPPASRRRPPQSRRPSASRHLFASLATRRRASKHCSSDTAVQRPLRFTIFFLTLRLKLMMCIGAQFRAFPAAAP